MLAHKEKLFQRHPVHVEVPNLIQNQLDSYNQFRNELIDEAFQEWFPMEVSSGNLRLEYLSSELEEPAESYKECKIKGKTYSGSLKANLRLINKETGEIIDSEVFFGEIPYMTPRGTFVSNGNERIIINQIVRSPGLYMTELPKGAGVEMRIIPSNGAWLTFQEDKKKGLCVMVDKAKVKVPVTLLIKAMSGMTSEEILEQFQHHPYIYETLSGEIKGEEEPPETLDDALIAFFSILRPDEPKVIERARKHMENLLYNPVRYSLADVGRMKMEKKLSLRERAMRQVLGEDVGPFKEGEEVTDEVLEYVEGHSLLVKNQEGNKIRINGKENTSENRLIEVEDLLGIVDYFLTYRDGIGFVDNIDHLGNRRIRLCGELLQTKFQEGFARVEKNIKERMASGLTGDKKLTPSSLINTRPLVAVLNEFLGSGQLSQYVEQVNPYAELSHKRRVSALGPGGFQKERASNEVRDVHYSHYGKMCPSETPEGPSVGLITSMAIYARINKYGIIETPYLRVDKKKGKLTNDIVYMTGDIDEKYYIAKAQSVRENGTFESDEVVVRNGGEYMKVHKTQVDYVDVAPSQIVGVGVQLVPFLQHDDSNRAVMGANMQRQAVPLLHPDKPRVGTGMERMVASSTHASYTARKDGEVSEVGEDLLSVVYDDGEIETFPLERYERTNDDSSLTHHVKVRPGERVKTGDVLADSTSSVDGELAVGKNLRVAFMAWNGYNFEDAIVVSEKLSKEDAYTVVTLEEYNVDVRDTLNGKEVVEYDVPQVSTYQRRHLDQMGVVKEGAEVYPGDVLIGKMSPKGKEDKKAEDKLLSAVFDDNNKKFKDSSKKAKTRGIVTKVVRISKEDTELSKGILEQYKVFVAQKRKVKDGDKMAGRHGNKGVISVVLPEEDMPYTEDGQPVDMVLNPLGVPSRMNIGQIMETHLGMAADKLDLYYRNPVFDGANMDDIHQEQEKAGISTTGKFPLYDGRSGEKFEQEVTVGVMYMMRLNHMIDDKMHARSDGPYSLITQQPLGGKGNRGGQRFGEMEVWALQAYGAAHMLKEMMTVKSDNVQGRINLYESLVKNTEPKEEGDTESLKLMIKELQALGISAKLVKEE